MQAEMNERENAHKREIYQNLRDEGLCGKCGKRWAVAGMSRCKICYDRWKSSMNKTDPDRQRRRNWINERNAERKAKQQCLDCGKSVAGTEFARCASCRKRRAEYQQVRRIKARIHKGGG